MTTGTLPIRRLYNRAQVMTDLTVSSVLLPDTHEDQMELKV